MMRTENDAPGAAPIEPPLISVVIATFNRRDMLQACLASVSAVEYPRFEAIVCVDSQSEVPAEAVRELAGDVEKIRVLACEGRSGTSATRNAGIEQARGEIVFFTDDDVIVSPDWLARGVPRFEDQRVVGIEGRIVYVADGYRVRYGDRVVENRSGGLYMTANAAYRRASLIEAGMFDEAFPHYQDRVLASRLRERGRIDFVEDCVVYHQLDRYTARAFMAEATLVRDLVLMMKRTGDRTQLVGRVYTPSKIAAILFPPLILLRLRSRRMSSSADVLLFLLSYPRLCFERLALWRSAVAERFFVI